MILDLPTVKAPAESLFTLSSMSTMKENPFNPYVEVAESDDYWIGELKYKNLNYDQARQMGTFIKKLRGTSGEFYFIDYVHKQQGAWAGTIRVNGANQDGTMLEVDGADPNVLIAPAGDRFCIGDHLYELTEDIYADADGEAQLRFLPNIRIIPDDDTLVIHDDLKCKFMLQPKQQAPQLTTKKALITDYSFKCRESLR